MHEGKSEITYRNDDMKIAGIKWKGHLILCDMKHDFINRNTIEDKKMNKVILYLHIVKSYKK